MTGASALGVTTRLCPQRHGDRPAPGCRIVRGPSALDDLGDDFDALLHELEAPITARRTWLACWARHHHEFEPVVVVVERAGVVSAVAPLAVAVTGKRHDVVALGHGESDYTRLPARTGEDAVALASGIAFLLQSLPDPWLLHLEQLPVAEPALHALRRRLWPVVIEPGEPSPFARLIPGGTPFVKSSGRRNARAGRNRLDRDGHRLEITHYRDEDSIRRLLPEVAELRAAREQALGRESLVVPARRGFWFEIFPLLARQGAVELITLRVGGALAAYGFGLLDHGAYRVWDARVSPRHARYKLGALYRDAVLQTVTAEGYTELDWMRGVEEYKEDTATDVRHTAQIWGASWSPRTAAPLLRAAWRVQRLAHPRLASTEAAVRARVQSFRLSRSRHPRP